jgi:hypothetical protein
MKLRLQKYCIAYTDSLPKNNKKIQQLKKLKANKLSAPHPSRKFIYLRMKKNKKINNKYPEAWALYCESVMPGKNHSRILKFW